jgi:hypothetical protein
MFFSEGVGIAELPENAGSALVNILTSALDHAWPLRDQVLEEAHRGGTLHATGLSSKLFDRQAGHKVLAT